MFPCFSSPSPAHHLLCGWEEDGLSAGPLQAGLRPGGHLRQLRGSAPAQTGLVEGRCQDRRHLRGGEVVKSDITGSYVIDARWLWALICVMILFPKRMID